MTAKTIPKYQIPLIGGHELIEYTTKKAAGNRANNRSAQDKGNGIGQTVNTRVPNGGSRGTCGKLRHEGQGRGIMPPRCAGRSSKIKSKE